MLGGEASRQAGRCKDLFYYAKGREILTRMYQGISLPITGERMKSRISIPIVIAVLVSIEAVWAQQDSVKIPSVELSGSFMYSMSSIPRASYTGAELETRTNTWAIQPAIAVFVFGYLQVCLESRFQWTRTETDYPSFPYQLARTDYISTSSIFVSVGPGYNLPLGPHAWVFLNLKGGLYWTMKDQGSVSESEQPAKWSTNQTVLPIIQGGFKFLLSTHSALIVQVQYDRLTDDKRRTTSFGMGFATFI